MEHSSAAESLEALLSQSPPGMRHNENPAVSFKCCCGRPQCVFLEHNNVALEGLEKDLRSAAQIGQALLVRHESNMREAEEERLRMAASIEKLEIDKKQLEASNAKTIEENRYLLDQLEGLNNTVFESDAHIQALTATLQSSREELRRLTVLAGRTVELEAQLTAMELEQAEMHVQLLSYQEDNKTAIERWQRAERTIVHLQDQVDRIEREAREERERHVEVLGRMERRRVVEKELESAAGRLKGAAAMTLGRNPAVGTNVVTHFVKDILQDNANLQMGIVELREMLMSSNAEVEGLREQMMLHHDGEVIDQTATLRAELCKEASAQAPPELHVHHHYHASEATVHRKPRRKRMAVQSGHFLPSSGSSTPRTVRTRDWRAAPPSSTATILSQTSVSVPPTDIIRSSQRNSVQSIQSGTSFAPSSMPSSPGSVFRSCSLFDNIDMACESSRPTSPESSCLGSPEIIPKDQFKSSKPSFRSFSTPTPLQPKCLAAPKISATAYRNCSDDDMSDIADTSISPLCNMTIPEESENTCADIVNQSLERESAAGDTPTTVLPRRPGLRHTTSHESLISISGMDIHTLRDRPSQIFTGRGFTPRDIYSRLSPTTPLSPPTSILSPTTATVRPALQRETQGSSSSSDYNRSILSAHARNSADGSSSLGKLVGGWVWGKKGFGHIASSDNLKAKASVKPFEGRPPGVNQSGRIRGIRPPAKAPTEIEPVKVDTTIPQSTSHINQFSHPHIHIQFETPLPAIILERPSVLQPLGAPVSPPAPPEQHHSTSLVQSIMVYKHNHSRHFYPYGESSRQQADPYSNTRERLLPVTNIIFPAHPPHSYVAGNLSSAGRLYMAGNPYALGNRNEKEPVINPHLPFSKRPDERFEPLREKVRAKVMAEMEEKQREVAHEKVRMTYTGREWEGKGENEGRKIVYTGREWERQRKEKGKEQKCLNREGEGTAKQKKGSPEYLSLVLPDAQGFATHLLTLSPSILPTLFSSLYPHAHSSPSLYTPILNAADPATEPADVVVSRALATNRLRHVSDGPRGGVWVVERGEGAEVVVRGLLELGRITRRLDKRGKEKKVNGWEVLGRGEGSCEGRWYLVHECGWGPEVEKEDKKGGKGREKGLRGFLRALVS